MGNNNHKNPIVEKYVQAYMIEYERRADLTGRARKAAANVYAAQQCEDGAMALLLLSEKVRAGQPVRGELGLEIANGIKSRLAAFRRRSWKHWGSTILMRVKF